MTYVKSFSGVTPPARFDGLPWTAVRIKESATAAGSFSLIDTLSIVATSTPDLPGPMNFTTTHAVLESGYYTFQFTDQAGTLAPATSPVLSPDPATLGGLYATAADLRTELDVDAATLSDEAALVIIGNACDRVDSLLGAHFFDETTGRKIVQDQVMSWQWIKLGRATVKLAATVYNRPEVLEGRHWQSVSGPDFSFAGAQASTLGEQFLSLLNDTGLRRMSGKASRRGRTGLPPWDEFVTNRDYRTDTYRD